MTSSMDDDGILKELMESVYVTPRQRDALGRVLRARRGEGGTLPPLALVEDRSKTPFEALLEVARAVARERNPALDALVAAIRNYDDGAPQGLEGGLPWRSDCGHAIDDPCPWCTADAPKDDAKQHEKKGGTLSPLALVEDRSLEELEEERRFLLGPSGSE